MELWEEKEAQASGLKKCVFSLLPLFDLLMKSHQLWRTDKSKEEKHLQSPND